MAIQVAMAAIPVIVRGFRLFRHIAKLAMVGTIKDAGEAILAGVPSPSDDDYVPPVVDAYYLYLLGWTALQPTSKSISGGYASLSTPIPRLSEAETTNALKHLIALTAHDSITRVGSRAPQSVIMEFASLLGKRLGEFFPGFAQVAIQAAADAKSSVVHVDPVANQVFTQRGNLDLGPLPDLYPAIPSSFSRLYELDETPGLKPLAQAWLNHETYVMARFKGKLSFDATFLAAVLNGALAASRPLPESLAFNLGPDFMAIKYNILDHALPYAPIVEPLPVNKSFPAAAATGVIRKRMYDLGYAEVDGRWYPKGDTLEQNGKRILKEYDPIAAAKDKAIDATKAVFARKTKDLLTSLATKLLRLPAK